MRPVILAAVAGLLLVASSARAQRERFTPDELDTIEQKWPHAHKTSTSIRYVVLKEGAGPKAQSGDFVSVLYTGTLLDGTQFDSDQDRAHPFRFRVDRGFVIRGWDQILQTMRAGEKRIVIIPADLAYGSRGQSPKIPRDAPLVFEVELTRIEHDQ